MYFILSVFPSLAIYPWENPSMLRTFTVIPSVVFFTSLGIIGINNMIQAISRKIPLLRHSIYLLLLLVLISSFYELRTYFKYQAPVFEHSFEIRHPLQDAIKMTNVYEKIIK